MKRSLIAVLLATFAAAASASNTQYNNEAGEQDLAVSIAKNDQYNNDAGQNDEHAPQIG